MNSSPKNNRKNRKKNKPEKLEINIKQPEEEIAHVPVSKPK